MSTGVVLGAVGAPTDSAWIASDSASTQHKLMMLTASICGTPFASSSCRISSRSSSSHWSSDCTSP